MSREHLRILHVVPAIGPRLGGTTAYVTGCAAALRRKGHDVAVYTSDMACAPRSRHIERLGNSDLPLDLVDVDVRLFPVRQPYRLVRTPGLARAVRRDVCDYDVLHIHNLWLHPQYVAARAAWNAAVPYVVSIHGAFDGFVRTRGRGRKALTMRLWQQTMLERASALHVTTEQELAAIADVAPDVPRLLAPPGLDFGRFSAPADGTAFRAERLPAGEGRLLLFVGRVAPKKGIDLLIEALPNVVSAQPDVRLAILGPDDDGLAAGLAHQAAELGVGHHVTFLEPRYGQRLLDALAGADVWVLPSRAENFGIAVVEALAAGVPVVATNEVDVAVAMEREGAGIATAVDASSIADALLRVLSNPAEAKRLEAAGPRFAARYDWDTVIDAHIEMYGRVALRRPDAGSPN